MSEHVLTPQPIRLETAIEKKLLHYTGKAIADFKMIQEGDKVLIALSGGKDSYTLVSLLNILRIKSRSKFSIFAVTLDQGHPGFDASELKAYLKSQNIPHEVLSRDTYSIVKEKIPENNTYCGLCSRLRRGILYTYAREHGFTKVALGHHRDDMIQTLLMSIFYNGNIRSMPPKLLSDDKSQIVIRPLAYCQEADIIKYAQARQYPIIPCNLCGSQENLMRQKVKGLIRDLSAHNPKVPSNMLHALQHIKPSQLMDKDFWDFESLESQRIMAPVGDKSDVVFSDPSSNF